MYDSFVNHRILFSEYCSTCALSCSFEFVVVVLRTVLVVLFLGLWLLLGCDNYGNQVMYPAWKF